MAIAVIFVGLAIDNSWLGLSGTLVALFVSLWVCPSWRKILKKLVTHKRSLFVASLGLLTALIGLLQLNGFDRRLHTWYISIPNRDLYITTAPNIHTVPHEPFGFAVAYGGASPEGGFPSAGDWRRRPSCSAVSPQKDVFDSNEKRYNHLNWNAVGALGGVFGAVGQILIALLAVYVAWRQYVISKDLTIQQNLLIVQQNLITQQQTIDTYFQGISDLVLDKQGLLEDSPQERAIAEGRTAAILSSVDAGGKAKILRFLSHSKLLTPLMRDRSLGRPILDGTGGYAEDRIYGVPVIELGVMLAGADLSGTDLRGTDLSEANLVAANLSRCGLVKTNLARSILYNAQLVGADLKEILLFYGCAQTATPRSRTEPPDYKTGVYTGAVVENADFTGVQRLSEPVRYYCCAWGGSKTRATIPGGCEGIPNQLGR